MTGIYGSPPNDGKVRVLSVDPVSQCRDIMVFRTQKRQSEPGIAAADRIKQLLANLPDETVLIQYNDRAPQFLFPKLQDRGYAHDTVETDDGVVTAIWIEEGDER
jgi:hypothetical protein